MKVHIYFNYTWADADESGNIGTSTFQFATMVSVPALPRIGDVIDFFPDLDEVVHATIRQGTVASVRWCPTLSKRKEVVLEPVIFLADISDESVKYTTSARIREVLIERGRNKDYVAYKDIERAIVGQGQHGGLQFFRTTHQT